MVTTCIVLNLNSSVPKTYFVSLTMDIGNKYNTREMYVLRK